MPDDAAGWFAWGTVPVGERRLSGTVGFVELRSACCSPQRAQRRRFDVEITSQRVPLPLTSSTHTRRYTTSPFQRGKWALRLMNLSEKRH